MPGRFGRCGQKSGEPLGLCFRGEGRRMTAAREAIIAVLEKSSEHLSADDVYVKVHRIYPRIGLTTVYRNLELLAESKVLAKCDFGDGRARYELIRTVDGEKEHHHHLVCTTCGGVTNYSEFIDEELQFLRRAEKGLSKKYDFHIAAHLIQFYGTCRKCSGLKK
jgi:Fur family transcriptional regulator, ferric uptake regulator